MKQKKYEISLSYNELDILTELAGLGDFIINGCRLYPDRIKKYDRVFNKIAKIYKKASLERQPEMAEDLRDIRSFVHDNFEEHLEFYEDFIFFSQIAKKLAEFQFPDQLHDRENIMVNHIKQQTAEHEYEKELKANNLANVSIAVPNLKEKQEQALIHFKDFYIDFMSSCASKNLAVFHIQSLCIDVSSSVRTSSCKRM